MDILIIGAGDGGRIVKEILLFWENDPPVIMGYLDDNPREHRLSHHYTVLGGLDKLADYDSAKTLLLCSIHDPHVRFRIVDPLKSWQFATAVSLMAYVSPYATISGGSIIYPHATVGLDVQIGPHCIISDGATIAHDCLLLPCCTINPGAHLAGRVRLERGVTVGMGANILSSVVVGEFAIIGAGAVVTEDVRAYATVAGVPARELT